MDDKTRQQFRAVFDAGVREGMKGMMMELVKRLQPEIDELVSGDYKSSLVSSLGEDMESAVSKGIDVKIDAAIAGVSQEDTDV